MTTNDRFGDVLAEWLHDDAAHRVPDHLAEVLVTTRATRQRPWWSSLERWLPMQASARVASTFPHVGRVMIVAVLIALALAAAVLLAGVGRPRLPAPFGPAANGDFVIGLDGDIVRLDPATGARTTLIGGPAWDFGAGYSRDGTRFTFGRLPKDPSTIPQGADPGMVVAVANADGSNVRELTPALTGNCWSDWSPDGRHYVFRSDGPGLRGVLKVLDVADGSLRTIDPGVSVRCGWIAYRPPLGNEILFRGDDGQQHAVYAIRPDGTGLRTVNTQEPVCDCDTGGISPDGRLVAVDRWGADGRVRIWLLDVDSGTERLLPLPPGTFARGGTFSPDGTQIAFPRLRSIAANQNAYQVVIAPVDGRNPGRTLGPELPLPMNGSDEAFASVSFAPDGRSLIVAYPDAPSSVANTVWQLPVDGSRGTLLDHGTFAGLDIQRRAP